MHISEDGFVLQNASDYAFAPGLCIIFCWSKKRYEHISNRYHPGTLRSTHIYMFKMKTVETLYIFSSMQETRAARLAGDPEPDVDAWQLDVNWVNVSTTPSLEHLQKTNLNIPLYKLVILNPI